MKTLFLQRSLLLGILGAAATTALFPASASYQQTLLAASGATSTAIATRDNPLSLAASAPQVPAVPGDLAALGTPSKPGQATNPAAGLGRSAIGNGSAKPGAAPAGGLPQPKSNLVAPATNQPAPANAQGQTGRANQAAGGLAAPTGAQPGSQPGQGLGRSTTPGAKAGTTPTNRATAGRPTGPGTGSKSSASAGGAATTAWVAQAGRSPALDMQKNLPVYQQLYTTPTSIGVVAVGVAEGNYQLVVQNGSLFVQPTSNYFGHTDPGNLSWGQTVTNFGPCSDQGRSGGNIALSESMCVGRLRDRLPTALQDLYQSGIDPYNDLEALLNAVDLYNQASPIHSRVFPQALAIAKRGGLYGPDAYAWARTAAFYLNDREQLDIEHGTNRAGGLLGICSREGRPVTQWECVYGDQARRVRAISQTYQSFLQLARNDQPRSNQPRKPTEATGRRS